MRVALGEGQVKSSADLAMSIAEWKPLRIPSGCRWAISATPSALVVPVPSNWLFAP